MITSILHAKAQEVMLTKTGNNACGRNTSEMIAGYQICDTAREGTIVVASGYVIHVFLSSSNDLDRNELYPKGEFIAELIMGFPTGQLP